MKSSNAKFWAIALTIIMGSGDGLPLLAQSTATITETVSKRNTIGTVTASPSSGVKVGDPVTYNYVLQTAGAPAPTTESVQFYDGANSIGSPQAITMIPASNLLPYSQVDTTNGWTTSGTAPTVTPNAVDGADGSTTTASTVAFPDTTSTPSAVTYAVPSSTSYAGQTVTLSTWLKSATAGTVNLVLTDSPKTAAAQVAPCTLSATWTRCTLTYTYPSNAVTGFEANIVSTGVPAQNVNIWGVQVEQAATAGPYVSTIGVARPTGGQAGAVAFVYSGFLEGSHAVTAQYAGDANFIGSTSNAAATAVGQAAATITLTDSPAGTSVYGVGVTLTAQVSGPNATATGTINFMDGSASLGTGTLDGSGKATITLVGATSLPVGTHTLTAAYSGDTNFNASTSAQVTHIVTKVSGAAIVTITSSRNPSIYGDAVKFSINVASTVGVMPTGTVTLVDGATTLGVVTLDASGNGAFVGPVLTAGSHSITATYSGDNNYQ